MRPPAHPVRTADGRFNIDWFADRLAALNEFQVDHWNHWSHAWPDYREQVDLLLKMAETCGIDLRSYAPDTLSITDISRIDDALAVASDQIERMISQINASIGSALQMVPVEKKNWWNACLRRILAIQRICREEVPQAVVDAHPGRDDVHEAWRLTLPLRFMLYCKRSTLNMAGGKESLVSLPDHLVRACVVAELAQSFRDSGALDVRGVEIVIPPRHGKTVFQQARRALRMCRDPWNPFAIVHANADLAAERVDGVKDWFDDDKPIGRRRAALFPRVRLNRRKSKAKSSLWLTLDGVESCAHKEGNLSSCGMLESAQGMTLVEIDFDDPVDEKERREAGSRERTNHAFFNTWLTRLTGTRSFFTLVSTCWHPDDVTGAVRRHSRSGAMAVAECSISCGGPEEKFRPLWPEMRLDQRFLLGKYRILGPPMYACIYQNNPDSAEGHRIDALRFYDWRMWTEPGLRDPDWERFLTHPETRYYLSIDPSGTDGKGANRAGIIQFCHGPFTFRSADGSTDTRPRCAALRMWSTRATQHGLVDEMLRFRDEGGRVDRYLIETTGGYHATAEELIRRGIPADKVHTRTPGQGTKIARLMRYAIHLECGDMVFPGEWTTDDSGDRVLTIHHEWERVADQLLRAGMSDDDEIIDVVRQMLAEVATDFAASHGWDPKSTERRRESDPMRAALDRYHRANMERWSASRRTARRGETLVRIANAPSRT